MGGKDERSSSGSSSRGKQRKSVSPEARSRDRSRSKDRRRDRRHGEDKKFGDPDRYDPEEWMGSPVREDNRKDRSDTRRPPDAITPVNNKAILGVPQSRFSDSRVPETKQSTRASSQGGTVLPPAPIVKVSKRDFCVVQIAAVHVPHVMGPRGANIKRLCQLSGAEIRIDHQKGSAHATAVITGNTAETAKQLLCKHLEYTPMFPESSIMNMT